MRNEDKIENLKKNEGKNIVNMSKKKETKNISK